MSVSRSELLSIEVGDYITFKSMTMYSNTKVKRKVRRVSPDIEVYYSGYDNFVVYPSEVMQVHKQNN